MCLISVFHNLPENEQNIRVDQMISGNLGQIIDSTEFSNAVADTNADGWDIDEYEFSIVGASVEDNEIRSEMQFTARGDQMDDMMFAGNRIAGTAEVVIDENDNVSINVFGADVIEE